jgi:hypothetical protein
MPKLGHHAVLLHRANEAAYEVDIRSLEQLAVQGQHLGGRILLEEQHVGLVLRHLAGELPELIAAERLVGEPDANKVAHLTERSLCAEQPKVGIHPVLGLRVQGQLAAAS